MWLLSALFKHDPNGSPGMRSSDYFRLVQVGLVWQHCSFVYGDFSQPVPTWAQAAAAGVNTRGLSTLPRQRRSDRRWHADTSVSKIALDVFGDRPSPVRGVNIAVEPEVWLPHGSSPSTESLPLPSFLSSPFCHFLSQTPFQPPSPKSPSPSSLLPLYLPQRSSKWSSLD